eukprot:CAMPEP_0169445354 /NCGR_PEP_ID=MMETSP1042-20121227/10397_1 /TAXON_ID=464988 /ORGANISM="Hemiselmis andersenii, Strain CCMP1180" /LENGTH=529 /DNA_ID=CAMNT_0009556749 /DNA_START=228 /DNA_END=1817 /DNA_ORIENTATION=+
MVAGGAAGWGEDEQGRQFVGRVGEVRVSVEEGFDAEWLRKVRDGLQSSGLVGAPPEKGMDQRFVKEVERLCSERAKVRAFLAVKVHGFVRMRRQYDPSSDPAKTDVTPQTIADAVNNTLPAVSISELEQQARQGVREAKLQLADVLYFGLMGVARDYMRACSLYNEAAQDGDNEAAVAIANIAAVKLSMTHPEAAASSAEDSNGVLARVTDGMLKDPVLEQIVFCLGKAASECHVSPLTLQVGRLLQDHRGSLKDLEGIDEIIDAVDKREGELLQQARKHVGVREEGILKAARSGMVGVEDIKGAANGRFREGNFPAAHALYTDALEVLEEVAGRDGAAAQGDDGSGGQVRATLLSNRSECWLQAGGWQGALDDLREAREAWRDMSEAMLAKVQGREKRAREGLERQQLVRRPSLGEASTDAGAAPDHAAAARASSSSRPEQCAASAASQTTSSAGRSARCRAATLAHTRGVWGTTSPCARLKVRHQSAPLAGATWRGWAGSRGDGGKYGWAEGKYAADARCCASSASR